VIRRLVIVALLGAGVALWLWLRPAPPAADANPAEPAVVLPERKAFDRFQQNVKLDGRTDYTAPKKEDE